MKLPDDIFGKIKQEISTSKIKFERENFGIVKEVKDEVVFFKGCDNIRFGESVEFKEGIKGLVIDLKEEEVGVIVFGNYLKIGENDIVKASGKILSVPVGDNFLARVVDGLGNPIDGLGEINATTFYPIERIAPSVIYRRPVDSPVQTGIKAIDALSPIGRGQRELIIGDRGTGKSTIAIDTILNQKNENIICIYNIIGQRNSKIAAVVDLLKRKGAMDYTIVVSASAADPISLQYVSPYTACTLGEYFMDKGKDVLIIYDDLSKHAWAYRQLSLVLRRPSGREAYPGDIFYLHSRLLERACRLDEKRGGGSLTALPIVETQEGDISGYIPTNIISITDGQIFLETDLFNAGIRPAINIGISVSRVGSAAQTKAMKQVAGKLRLELAQYRELAAFAQFEAELDEKTKKFLDRGGRITEVLKQNKNQPLDLARQVLILWAGVNGYLDSLPVSKIEEFERKFLEYIELKDKKIIDLINKYKILDKKIEDQLPQLVKELMRTYYSPQNTEESQALDVQIKPSEGKTES